MRVLVVDDSVSVRARVVAMLREIVGVRVIDEADEGVQALELVVARKPDLVVLDLHLPGTQAFDLLRRIKRVIPPPLIVVLTNDASEQHRRECLARGADFFFDKSKDFDRIVEIVSSRLRS